uniref:Uncharacterized protein n=1 Tax=Arundo donax TaxID=35708 RepID=A0A0A9H9I5_ARUDO
MNLITNACLHLLSCFLRIVIKQSQRCLNNERVGFISSEA